MYLLRRGGLSHVLYRQLLAAWEVHTDIYRGFFVCGHWGAWLPPAALCGGTKRGCSIPFCQSLWCDYARTNVIYLVEVSSVLHCCPLAWTVPCLAFFFFSAVLELLLASMGMERQVMASTGWRTPYAMQTALWQVSRTGWARKQMGSVGMGSLSTSLESGYACISALFFFASFWA